MTPDHFLARHLERWMPLQRDPLFIDLIETIRHFDPSRSLPAVSATDATENAQHLLGRIAGFNLAVNVLTEGLKPPPLTADIEPTYPDEDEEPTQS